MTAAYLHALGDVLQNVAVCVAGVIVWLCGPSTRIADPITTILFGMLVFYTTVPITRRCMHVLMEGWPPKLDHDALLGALGNVGGVGCVDHVSVWSINISTVGASVQATKSVGGGGGGDSESHALVVSRLRQACEAAFQEVGLSATETSLTVQLT